LLNVIVLKCEQNSVKFSQRFVYLVVNLKLVELAYLVVYASRYKLYCRHKL
jgi:hypothetical protein